MGACPSQSWVLSHSSTLPFFILMLRVEEARKSTGSSSSLPSTSKKETRSAVQNEQNKVRNLRCHVVPADLWIQTFQNTMLPPSSATRYGAEGPGVESRWEQGFPHPALNPLSLLYNLYRVSSLGVKRPGRGVNHPSHLAPRSNKE